MTSDWRGRDAEALRVSQFKTKPRHPPGRGFRSTHFYSRYTTLSSIVPLIAKSTEVIGARPRPVARLSDVGTPGRRYGSLEPVEA
jgi:hypothetical protein